MTATHCPWLELHLLHRQTLSEHCCSPHHAASFNTQTSSPNSLTPPAAPSWPAAQVSDDLQDGEPGANAPCLLSHRLLVVTDALVGIQADFHLVVEQGEEGCQGDRLPQRWW